MKRKRTATPQFESLDEEMDFWASHSLTEFELRDVTTAELVRAAAKQPRRRSITLRLDERVIAKLKLTARRRGVSDDALVDELLRKQLKVA